MLTSPSVSVTTVLTGQGYFGRSVLHRRRESVTHLSGFEGARELVCLGLSGNRDE